MIRVWGRTSSINVQKVMWAVAELGLAHEQIDAGGKFGGLDTTAFRTLNPNARVPVIEDGDQVVWESHTTVRYLAAGADSMWPSDPFVRSLSERWMDWTLADLQPALAAECSGHFTGHPNINVSGRQSGRLSLAARSSSGSWTGT